VVGKLIEQIVGRGEKNFLCAVPLGVAMCSHLRLTIAQFGFLSKPTDGGVERAPMDSAPFGNGADFIYK
jgi:hypothetical protein